MRFIKYQDSCGRCLKMRTRPNEVGWGGDFDLPHHFVSKFKVARYSFSGSIPPKFERKLRRHKQRFEKINTTVVLDKDENLL